MKVRGILQAAASSEWLTPFRLLMLPLVQFPADFRIAVALLHGGLCRLSAGTVKALSPSDFQREADVCDNCNQVFSVTITPPLWSP